MSHEVIALLEDKDQVVLEGKNISKSFPGVKALTNVDLKLHRGEVVALLGENGAGKSTLIKVLSGIYIPEAGTIEMYGNQVHFNLPQDALEAGIGVIHQELNYVATISIAENIFMGRLPMKHGFVDYKTMYEQSGKILDTVGLKLNPKQNIGQCSVAQKQLIEIAKVLYFQAKVLILDEPTSALNNTETEYLFNLIRKASANGVSILYISHKLDELFAIANRIVVLRDGSVTGEVMIDQTDKDELITLMVGRRMDDMYPKAGAVIGETILSVKNIHTDKLTDISFETRRGEIFGIYGLMGSGHQQIGCALFGQDNILSGDVFVKGKKITINRPGDAIASGIAYVPAERKTEGLVLNQSVAVNTVAAKYCKDKSKLLNDKKDLEIARMWIDKLHIKTPSARTLAESLSGGNQQKVVLARWLALSPDIFILNEPTRGIDVGAKSEIYRILDELCQQGKCIVIITSEMPELLAMSDRIMVMFEGKVSGFLDGKTATQEQVVKLAIGG